MTHEEKKRLVHNIFNLANGERTSAEIDKKAIEMLEELEASAEKKGREEGEKSLVPHVAYEAGIKEGWNEAIEEASDVVRSRCPDDDGECRCTFVKLSEEINKLKRG